MIAPGYKRSDEDGQTDNTVPYLPRSAQSWKNAVQSMVESGEPWQLITTYNEWGEGTGIEPVKDWNIFNDNTDPELSERFYLETLGSCSTKLGSCN